MSLISLTSKNKSKENTATSQSAAKTFDYEAWKTGRSTSPSSGPTKTFDYEAWKNGTLEPKKTDRGTLDRVFGILGNTSIIEGLYNVTDNDPSSTFGEGLVEGVKYMNPFLDDVSGRHTFSDVLKNVGIEDSNPDKFTLGDVGRGALGLAGDIVLDPLSYINPYSAASKVIKGTGVTLDGVRAMAKVDKIADAAGSVGDAAKNVNKVRNLTQLSLEDVKGIVKQFKGYDGQNLDEVAQKVLDDYNRAINRAASGGEDFSIGLKHLPFMEKRAQSLNKTLVKSDQLREFGDKTIAPYYNTMMKKMRTSKIGQMFSTKNQLEALAMVDELDSVAKFHTKELLKGFKRLDLDLKDIKAADQIEEYWGKLSKNDQYKWLQAYETGKLKRAFEFQKIRANIEDAYHQMTGEDGSKVWTSELINSNADLARAKSQMEELESVEKEVTAFLEKKKAELGDDFVNKALYDFGLTGDSDPLEIVLAYRASEMVNALPNDTRYSSLMKYYKKKNSSFSLVRDKVTGKMTEADAYESFLKLQPEERAKLVNDYFENTGLSKSPFYFADESIPPYRDDFESDEAFNEAMEKYNAEGGFHAHHKDSSFPDYKDMNIAQQVSVKRATVTMDTLQKAFPLDFRNERILLGNADGVGLYTFTDGIDMHYADIAFNAEPNTFGFSVSAEDGNPGLIFFNTDTNYVGEKLDTLSKASSLRNNEKLNNIISDNVLISPEATVIHEYGHNLYDYFCSVIDACRDMQKAQSYWSSLPFEQKNMVEEILRAHVDYVKFMINLSVNTDNVVRNVSRYAAKNDLELFAELFSDAFSGQPSKEALEFVEHIKKITGFDFSETIHSINKKLEDIDEQAYSAIIDRIKKNRLSPEEKQKISESIFENTESFKFYKFLDELNGTDHMSTLKSIDERMSHIQVDKAELRQGEKVYRTFGEEEGIAIAKLISERMSEIAKNEIPISGLTEEQVEALDGKYLFHMTKENLNALKTLVQEERPGVYNPDILGILHSYEKSRTGGTIAEINKFGQTKEVEILETSLAEMYLARCLGSNHLVYGRQVQDYIRNVFGKENVSGFVAEPGFSLVVRYEDLEKLFKRLSHTDARTEIGRKYSTSDFGPFTEELQSTTNKKYQQYLNDFANLGDKNFKRDFVPNLTMQKLTREQAEMFARLNDGDVTPMFQLNDNILEYTNVLSRAQKMEQQSAMLNLYDKYLHIWKLNNSLVAPSFHVQNSVSNAFQSFLGVGVDAFNLRQIKKAGDILRTRDPKQTIKLGEKVWTYKELEHVAKKSGVVDELFSTYEFGKQGKTLSSFDQVKWEGLKSLDPRNLEGNVVYQASTVAGTNIESVQRMNLFMSALKQGKTVEEAAEMVDEFLFNYGALTDFEKETMKRIIPFYTFMRKNIPMELKQMLEQPQTFSNLNKAFTNIEKTDERGYKEENERNEWRQDYVQIPYSGWGVNPQLPYQQLDKFDWNKMLGSTSPVIKAPIEAVRGEYLYTGIPIDGIGEYAASQTTPTSYLERYVTGDQSGAEVLSRLLGFPAAEM